MTDLANPINRHDYLQPYDELTIGGRPAVFLWWMWKGRNAQRRVGEMIEDQEP